MCGNTSLDVKMVEDEDTKTDDNSKPSSVVYDIRSELTNCTYLQDSSVDICGVKVYGKI